MKKFLSVILCTLLTVSVAACGGSGKDSSKKKEKEYIKDSKISAMFSSPDDYKGKYVKLSGKIFVAPEEEDDGTYLQIYQDPENMNHTFIAVTKSTDLSDGDYVTVDGKIEGEYSGKNALGGEVKGPTISNATVKKSSYIDVVAPSLKTVKVESSAKQGKLTFTVHKIEYSKKETRVYVSFKNKLSVNATLDTSGIKIIKDGKQITQDQSSMSSTEGNYEQLDYDISGGVTSSGILVFPAMKPGKCQIVLSNVVDGNFTTEYSDFKVTVK